MRKVSIILFAIFISSCSADIGSRITYNTAAIIFVLVIIAGLAYYFFYYRNKFYANGYMSVLMRSHAIDYVPSALAITCDRRQILVFNPRAEEMFGWKEIDLIGIQIDRVIPEDQCKIFEDELSMVVNDGAHPRYFDICLMRKNGKVFFATMKIGVHREHSNNHYIYIIRDVTEQRKREDELNQYLQLYRSGEIMSGFGSWQWDLIKDEVLLSEGFRKVFDVDKQIVSGHFLMKLIHIKDRERVGKVLKEAIDQNQPYEIEYMLKHGDNIVPVVVKARPVVINGTIKIYNGIVKIRDDGR